MKLSPSTLEKCCGPTNRGYAGAARAACDLGTLARWWLTTEALACLSESNYPLLGKRPRIPSTLGSCWALFVNRHFDNLPLLAPAVVLPLCWKREHEHDPKLPASLRQLAEGITHFLDEQNILNEQQPAYGNWGLCLSECLEEIDLSELGPEHLGCDSAWLPLAGGLLLAVDNIRPRVDVFATGPWKEDFGIGPVEGIEHKLQAAREFGAECCFVPPSSAYHARTWQRAQGLPDSFVKDLEVVSNDPRHILNPYLSQLGQPPQIELARLEENLQARIHHYLRQPNRHPPTVDYYWKHLLPTIVARVRAQIVEQWPEWKPVHLVTILSQSNELVPLMAQATGVKRCLLLQTRPDTERERNEMKGRSEPVVKFLREKGIEAHFGEFHEGRRDELTRQFRQLVTAFLPPGCIPEELAIDITPGKKVMSLALADIAPQECGLLYLDHSIREGRPQPDTEYIQLWRGGALPTPVVLN